MYFDPMYFVFMIPALILVFWAQSKVKGAYSKYRQVPNSAGATGAQAARAILDANGLQQVSIEQTPGELSDHYDPRTKVLRLSPEVYSGRSIASIGFMGGSPLWRGKYRRSALLTVPRAAGQE